MANIWSPVKPAITTCSLSPVSAGRREQEREKEGRLEIENRVMRLPHSELLLLNALLMESGKEIVSEGLIFCVLSSGGREKERESQFLG